MATIGNDSNGRKRILFVAGDGSRKTVRLGKASQRDAEQVCRHIETLAAAAINGQPISRETSIWVSGIGHKLHDRLARAGLVKSRTAIEGTKLGQFINGYLAQRQDVKPGTMIVFQQAKRHLLAYMGEAKPVTNVTAADADAYRAHLLGRGIARATVAKWCQYARHFFEVARRRKLIDENPFAHIKATVRGNPARRVFVSAEDVRKVIDAAPDPEWKLLIALARWGGLRIPSEALALTWGDVDFDRGRFTVRASKTEHHADGGIRVVPMFPELAEHFQRVFDAAQAGTVHVITRYRDPAQNLRTQLVRYITAAGLTPWPKPWQNMRATRATELADAFPSHVCAAWLGHTEAVADAFYRQVTDDHFARASAAQNPAQYDAESSRMEHEAVGAEMQNRPEIQSDSASYDTLPNTELGAAGFEPATKGL